MRETQDRQTKRQPEALREQHERLLREAMRQPGVAEVIEVYGRLAPYAPQPVAAKSKTRYATGGNG